MAYANSLHKNGASYENEKHIPMYSIKGVGSMQNYETYEESKFFEKLMEDGQKIAKANSDKCKNCSYEICSECRIRKDEEK